MDKVNENYFWLMTWYNLHIGECVVAQCIAFQFYNWITA